MDMRQMLPPVCKGASIRQPVDRGQGEKNLQISKSY
jgi:hypothetical protein